MFVQVRLILHLNRFTHQEAVTQLHSMLVLQITLLESLHGGHCVEGVPTAGALFAELAQPARRLPNLRVVITALLVCYKAIL
jgi:hypothetical protein